MCHVGGGSLRWRGQTGREAGVTLWGDGSTDHCVYDPTGLKNYYPADKGTMLQIFDGLFMRVEGFGKLEL